MTTGGLTESVEVMCVRELRRRIAFGYYHPGDLLPNENALSGELGISRSMVGRALRQLDREGFFDARRGVGRRIRERAYPRRNGNVAVLLSDPAYFLKPGGRQLMDALLRRLMDERLSLQTVSMCPEPGTFHYQIRQEAVRRVNPEALDGLVLLTQSVEMETALELSTYCPVVWFHHTTVKPGLAGVRYDWTGGAFAVTRHLLARGCRDIGHVNIHDCFTSGREQVDGMRLALREVPGGGQARFTYIPVRRFDADSGYEATRRLLAERGERLDALVSGSDDYTPGVYRALSEAGRLGKVRLASWNGTLDPAQYPTPIDVVRLDFSSAGRQAAESLAQMLAAPEGEVPTGTIEAKLEAYDA